MSPCNTHATTSNKAVSPSGGIFGAVVFIYNAFVAFTMTVGIHHIVLGFQIYDHCLLSQMPYESRQRKYSDFFVESSHLFSSIRLISNI